MRKLIIALTFVAMVVTVVLITAAPSEAHCRSYQHSHYNPYGPNYYGYGCGYGPYDYDPYYPSYPYGYGPYNWPVPMIPQTPPVVIQPAPPTTYIEKPAEQKQPEQKQAEQQYLSYCKEKDKFFPEVGTCPSAWLKIVSSPAPEQTERYWKYCREKSNKGFSPYVPECPSGWLYVIPETNPPK